MSLPPRKTSPPIADLIFVVERKINFRLCVFTRAHPARGESLENGKTMGADKKSEFASDKSCDAGRDKVKVYNARRGLFLFSFISMYFCV